MTQLTFTVTLATDSPSATANDGTLRGAMLAANAVGAGNSALIDFAIADPGSPQTIDLASTALPTLDVPTVINGWSQHSLPYTGAPLITIDGAAVANINGITLDKNTSGSTIEGLAIVGFVASTRTGTVMKGAGLLIEPGSNGDIVQGNYFGLNGDDTEAANDYGIVVSSSNNTIGGTATGAGNVISGNKVGGLALFPAETTATPPALSTVSDNLIEGNLIGTNAAGTGGDGNGALPMGSNVPLGYGLGIAGATGTTIGGTSSAGRNVISDGLGSGITMTAYIKDLSDYDPSSGEQLATTGNLAIGNYIGVDATGLAGLGNVFGVIVAGAASNTIGGTATGATNVISANESTAIAIMGASATDDVLLGNYIGTDSTGNVAQANLGTGVYIGDAASFSTPPITFATGVPSGATIGGTAAGAGNVIASNTGDGIAILGTIATKSTGDSILANSIGLFVNATAAGNSGSGIAIQYSSGISLFDNTIKNNAGGINITNSTAQQSAARPPAPATWSRKIRPTASRSMTASRTSPSLAIRSISNKGTGIFSSSEVSSAQILDNAIESNTKEGIYFVAGSVDITVQGNTISGNASGMIIDGASTVTIGGSTAGAGNTITGSTAGSGIFLDSGSKPQFHDPG